MDTRRLKTFHAYLHKKVIRMRAKSEMEDKGSDYSQPQQRCQATDCNTEPFKAFVPQIVAAFISALFHFVCGIALAYSAVIIPQLEHSQNSLNGTGGEIYITDTHSSWIASSMPLVISVGALAGGPIMDHFGRLNVIRLAVIPSAVGWLLIAIATDMGMILSGRVLTGLAAAWGMPPCMVYISEISHPRFRGTLVAVGPTLTSLGMVCGYLGGWLLHWKVLAWISLGCSIVPLIVMAFTPRSPQWLVSKGKHEQAKNALMWINKYYSQPLVTTEMQFNQLIKECEIKQKQPSASSEKNGGILEPLYAFMLPTVYKPFLVLLGLFVLQQLSGIFLMLFYAVTFVQEAGTGLDPFLVSVLIGVVRLIAYIIALWLMKLFGRRQLMIASGLGMSLSMVTSALYTNWILEGTTTLNWIPVVMFMLYVACSTLGFLGTPITIISELYPLKGRGVSQCISVSVLYLLMFVSIHCYYILNDILGGSSGLQYSFAAGSMAGVIYCYIFLPETHNKTLTDVGRYFERYSTYVSYKIEQRKLNRNPDINSEQSSSQAVGKHMTEKSTSRCV